MSTRKINAGYVKFMLNLKNCVFRIEKSAILAISNKCLT